MNPGKLQDTKAINRNLVAFLHTNSKVAERNQENNTIYNCIKKIPGNKYNQGGERPLV